MSINIHELEQTLQNLTSIVKQIYDEKEQAMVFANINQANCAKLTEENEKLKEQLTELLNTNQKEIK
jgi:septal ring factor EnvC (AmiA/AmiB activator)